MSRTGLSFASVFLKVIFFFKQQNCNILGVFVFFSFLFLIRAFVAQTQLENVHFADECKTERDIPWVHFVKDTSHFVDASVCFQIN